MKKKLLLTAIILILGLPLLAQHYFPQDSAEWKVYYQKTEGPVTHKSLKSHTYNEDTVMMGISYKKIITTSSNTPPEFEVSYLREVDSTQQVYILLNDGTAMTEYLLYDFSKSIGDTVSIPVKPYGVADTTKWYVYNEGYVTIGQQQRRFMDLQFIGFNPFQNGDSIYMDRWIEGIGSVRGLFAPFLDDGSFGIGELLRYHLVCFTDKGEGVHYEPDLLKDSTFIETNLYTYYDTISHCSTVPWDNLSQGESVVENVMIQAYPNPFIEELKLYNPTGSTANYTLHLISGELILEGELRKHQTISIQTGHLPKGFYLLTIRAENQVFNTKILCK